MQLLEARKLVSDVISVLHTVWVETLDVHAIGSFSVCTHPIIVRYKENGIQSEKYEQLASKVCEEIQPCEINRNVLYRVSQEECAILRESVPYVKVYRYNPKHLCPKLNGYGDNGQRRLKL